MIACLPFCKLSGRSHHIWQDFDLHDTSSIHVKVGQKLIIWHVCTIFQHSFPNCYPIAYMDLVNNTMMPSAQLTLPICNNQCHPQSYPHHQSNGMKALLTWCSASDSHSLIKIFLLDSLGILEGFFHCDRFVQQQRKKITFCYFECFGVVKVAQFGLVKLEVFKIKYFCSKKNFDNS